jgi:outer membrane protein assembly factor BamA
MKMGGGIKRLHLIAGLVLLLIVLYGPRSAADEDRLGITEEVEEFAERGTPAAETGMSLAPILAYEPTFGGIFGGAAFLERPFDPRYRLFTRGALSSRGEYSILFSLRRWYREDMFYDFEIEVDDFARPYYGEGMTTVASDRIMLEGTASRALYYFRSRKDVAATFGPYLDFRRVQPEGIDGSEITPPDFDESSLAIGYFLTHDSRDSRLSPSDGRYTTARAHVVPDALTTYEGNRGFIQAEVDHRSFSSLGPGMVLAKRFYAGGSWGTPSYQFRYSVGGPYYLRGFFTNRFRGDKFYVVQGELRKHLFWIGSAAFFAEIGEATDEWFRSPKSSVGAGLRFTLPPDHVAKARLDFAWAEDQKSVYFIFGEAF